MMIPAGCCPGDPHSLPHEPLHALIIASESVLIDQILPDAFSVPAPPQRFLDGFSERFTLAY
jgi:hypothetical protein